MNATATTVASCPACQSPLPAESCNTSVEIPCPVCAKDIQVEVFPALFRQARTGLAPELIVEGGVASCFFHENKKAVAPCDACGRFLCALCQVEFGGRQLCPGCLESGRAKGTLAEVENQRILYDGAALSLAALPLLLPFLWFFLFVTAPVAIWLAVRSFRKPGSLVSPGRARAVAAIVLGVAGLGVAGFLAFAMIRGFMEAAG
jgi:hypothetical protein